jgi:uncharacterized protein
VEFCRYLARPLTSPARVALAVCIGVLAAAAPAAPAFAQALPKLSEPVHDFAGVLDDASMRELDRRIRALQAQTPTHDVVVVVTVKSLDPYDTIEEYAVRLFEQAGIGDKERDNGLLILLAPNDRQVRIEVGYELEQFVTDGFAGDTIRQEMLPAFRGGNYGAGVLAGATRVINRIAEGREVVLADVPKPVRQHDDFPWATLLPIGIVLIVIIVQAIKGGGRPGGRRRGPWWGGFGGPFGGGFGGLGGRGGFGGFGGLGRGGGGGFGGFGGGWSGGGGASGRW